ncbi:MAG: PQQ-like beta-propeller repeat protein [Bacteroidia bacterium]|nr:PQQ-like beta-propeller repeat protein [Bacteroidia bacterium]
MKKVNLVFSIMIMLLIYSANLYSQDWPQFRGINRDGKVTGFKAPTAWPDTLIPQWKIKVGTGDATPVLAGKKIYLHTRQEGDEVIICVDAITGKAVWADKYPVPPVTGPAAAHPGPRSTPAVADGKIVTFGTSGILSCLDAKTGKVIWRRENPANAIPQFFTGMSPLIVDGICIAHVGTKDNGNVIALDLKTGNEKWNWKGDGPAYASPSLMVIAGKKHVIVQTEKNLMALDFSDGKMLWQIPTLVQSRFYNCVSPYIDGNRIYYTGQGTGTKAVEVIKEEDNYTTKELWSTTEVGAKWNTPVLKGGFLYGFTDQRRIYCLNAADGKTAWIDAATHSDFATIVDCGQVIIGFSQTGNLVVFKPDPSAYSEVAKYKVSLTPVYTYPVIAGKLIYIKDAENLILYKIN